MIVCAALEVVSVAFEELDFNTNKCPVTQKGCEIILRVRPSQGKFPVEQLIS